MSTHHTTCILCENDQLTPLPMYAGHNLGQCKKCGFVFALSGPDGERTDDFTRLNLETIDTAATQEYYDALLDSFERFRESSNLLDIGCGSGELLAGAREKGWNVFGVEKDPANAKACEEKGISDVSREGIDVFGAEMFDVVICLDVIERVADPMSFLAGIERILRPGGVFFCTTPNFNSLQRRYLKKDFDGDRYPRHLCYFTSNTLLLALGTTTIERDDAHTSGLNIASMKRLENKDAKRHLQLAKNFVDTVLLFTGTGDTIEATFVKQIPEEH